MLLFFYTFANMRNIDKFDKFRQNLHSLAQNFDKYRKEFINSQEPYLIDLNTEKLWKNGEDSKGITLGEYAPLTKQIKNATGQGYGRITDHVTLYDTGSFYDKMLIKWNSDIQFNFDSTDSKNAKLKKVYGDDIHGIDVKENEKDMRDELLEPFQKFIFNKLKL